MSTVGGPRLSTIPKFTNTYSLDFDGMDDYVDVGEIPPLFKNFPIGTAKDNPWSASMWVKGSTSGAFLQLPYVETNIIGARAFAFAFTGTYLYFGGKFANIKIRESEPFAGGVTSFSTTDWNHVLMTFDGVDYTALSSYKLYVNGTLIPIELIPTNITDFRVKSILIGGTQLPWLGKIDEVSLFDAELTTSSVTSIYNGGKPTDLTPLNPIAWYRMGDNGAYKSPQWLLPSNENKDKVSNYSFEFDGVDDDFTSGDLSALVDNKSKLSISFWVNLPNASEINRITGKYGGSLTKWIAVTCTSNKVSFVVSNIGSSLAYAETSPVLSNNTWHHVVCVFDGTQATATDRIKIYIDNTNETFGFNNTLPTSTYDFTLEPTNPTWYVAQSGAQLGNNELRGKLDEYAIYSNVALTPSQVNEINNGGTPNDLNTLSVTPDLWYRMGEEAKFTSNWLVDNSVLSNYSKRSFDFDGVDDYISVSDNSIGQTQNISYSIWVNLDVTTRQYIIGNQSSSNGGCGLSIETGDVLIFQMADGTNDSFFNSRVASFSTYAPINTWNHILATWDGTDSKIYINGVLRNTWSPTLPYTISGYDTTFNIGWRNAGLIFMMNGKLDELALFNTAISIGDVWDGSGQPIDVSAVSGLTNNWRMGEDASFNGTNWTVPDNLGTSTGTSANMTVDSLVGEAPNYSGGGISNAMTIEDRVGDAPNSENNALSYNMDEVDRVEDTP